MTQSASEEYDIHLALIGGVAFDFVGPCDQLNIYTPYGDVIVYLSDIGGKKIALIPRHRYNDNHVPPHMINYRANIHALKELGIKRIIATNSVGTMKNHPVGSFFLPDDFIDFTSNRSATFFDEKTVHLDVSEPYCPELRIVSREILTRRNIGFSEGVYVCTEGPRFEKKAEIRMMGQFGDVVGMTGIPELVLAREMNMCYLSICTVTNDACGSGSSKMTVSEVLDVLKGTNENLKILLMDIIDSLPEKRSCNCIMATFDATL